MHSLSVFCSGLQSSPLFCAPGLVKFVPGVARLFCLALPGFLLNMFAQNKGDLCTVTIDHCDTFCKPHITEGYSLTHVEVEDDVLEGEVWQREELEAPVVPVQHRPEGRRPPRRPHVPAPERLLPGGGRHAAAAAGCRRRGGRRRGPGRAGEYVGGGGRVSVE